MPNYAIARMAKQKGGSVASSGHHNDRTRDTPNADPARQELNRLLIGDERNVREIVTEAINQYGGKPRRDSVEALEIVLTATRAYFTNERDEIVQEKVDRFVERGIAFLKDTRSGGMCVKATLHMDERTPHIQAHKVPITPEGKLSCKFYFGNKQQWVNFQDLYYEYMKPLGLERGERGSFAEHVEIRKFYEAIKRDHEIRIDPQRLPGPPLIHTAGTIRKYKEEIIKSVHEQIAEPLKTLRHQAMLTREEASKKEAARQLLEAAGREIAETQARLEAEQQMRLSLQNSFNAAVRSNRDLGKQLAEEKSKSHYQSVEIQNLHARLEDIPLSDVMERLRYRCEQVGKSYVYKDEHNVVRLCITDNVMRDSHQQVICQNSVDLVLYMRNEQQGVQTSREQAVDWLADTFGQGRALAASLCQRQQETVSRFVERREEQARLRESLSNERLRSTPERSNRGSSRSGR
jgi:hypothetical protein